MCGNALYIRVSTTCRCVDLTKTASGGLRNFSSVNIKTRQEKWKFKTEGEVRSSPAIADEVVYFGSEDSHLYAVDIKTGQQKWKFKTGGWVSSSPAVADGVVYFGNTDGHLYAVR